MPKGFCSNKEGVSTIGFRVPELSANSKAPLAEGTWEMKFVKFTHGESSQKKTPFVQVVWKVIDEEAVDSEGEPYNRNFFGDTFYLTENAMWRIKKFASEAEVEIPESGEEYDSLAEYTSDLTDAFAGLEGVLTVIHETYPKKGEDPDNEDEWTGLKALTAEDGYKF